MMRSIQFLKFVIICSLVLLGENFVLAQWNPVSNSSTTTLIDRTGDVIIGTIPVGFNLSGDGNKVRVFGNPSYDAIVATALPGPTPGNPFLANHTSAIRGINPPSAYGLSYGVSGESYSASSLNYGLAFGVLGTAGNAPNNRNYGVVGIIRGSNSGAAIVGLDVANNFSFGGDTQGNWAGYFKGSVHVSENVGVGTTSPTKKLHVHGGNAIIKGKGNFSNSGDQAILCLGDDNHFIKSEFAKGVTLGTYNHPNGIFLEESTGNMQVGKGITKISIGSAYGQFTDYGTSYVGYNAARSSTGNWLFSTDNAHNGGSVIYSNVGGALNFVTVASLDPLAGGTSNQTLTDIQIVDQIKMKIEPDGKVVIGQVASPGNYKLYVPKGIITERVKIAVVNSTNWADYVFDEEYDRNPIEKVAAFVKENKHLPNVPSAMEVEKNGIDLAEMDATLLRQVEELWLHVIDLKKEIETLKAINVSLESNK